MRRIWLIGLMIFFACPMKRVESIISHQGSVININGTKFTIPEGGVPESIKVKIEIFETRGIFKKNYGNGYIFTGRSISIKPENLIFEKPVLLSYPTKNQRYKLATKIGKGFAPIADSKVIGETLQAKIYHSGEYYIIETPEKYGILNHSKADSALLIVSDIYVSDYIKNFCQLLKKSNYQYPIWIFVYPNEKSIEENARFLAEELKKLHDQYGKFRLDVVSFGIGGLITHRYIADTALYQGDISPAVIAVGTPFGGSNFASFDSVKKGKSPFRFFFIDGMGENGKDLIPGSNFISWVLQRRVFLRGDWLKRPEESKNFASLRGKKTFPGNFAEEQDGDGLVSLNSTMLTAIEPDPFYFDHFELFESPQVNKIIKEFIELYRSFTNPLLFAKVWKGEEKVSKITEIWEKEARLNFRKDIDFDVLLEFNENILKSAPKDAILITNGDNDTYPGWYLQEKKGIRRDVIIVNRSLLNLPLYVHFLKDNGLPLEMKPEEIDSLHPIVDKKTKKILYVSDQLIDRLLKQHKRPLVFSTTVSNPHQYGYPLKLSGLVYEIGEGEIDIERTKELLHKEFGFNKFFSASIDSLSEQIKRLATNYASSIYSLVLALMKSEKLEEALQEVKFAERFVIPQPFFNYDVIYYHEALLYSKLGKKELADSVLKEILKNTNLEPKVRKQIAEVYFDMGMEEEAISVLADALKQNPNDAEIPDLIKRYQEGK